MTFWFDIEFGGRCAALTDIYLSPSSRRKGFGSCMLRHIEKFSIKAGCGALELQVEDDNFEALAFYKACGYRRHDRIPMSKRFRNR